MSIEAIFDKNRNIISMIVGNGISVDELVAEYEAMLMDQRFAPNMHVIWDISHLDLKRIPVSDIRQLPRQLNKFMQQRGNDYKAAIVTSRSMDFQLLKIYLNLLKLIGSNFQMKIFQSLEQAYDWIEA